MEPRRLWKHKFWIEVHFKNPISPTQKYHHIIYMEIVFYFNIIFVTT